MMDMLATAYSGDSGAYNRELDAAETLAESRDCPKHTIADMARFDVGLMHKQTEMLLKLPAKKAERQMD